MYVYLGPDLGKWDCVASTLHPRHPVLLCNLIGMYSLSMYYYNCGIVYLLKMHWSVLRRF